MTEKELYTSNKIYSYKLTLLQCKEIYKRKKNGESINSLAKEFKVEWHTITKAIQRHIDTKTPSYLRKVHYGGSTEEKWAKKAKKNHQHIIEKWCK